MVSATVGHSTVTTSASALIPSLTVSAPYTRPSSTFGSGSAASMALWSAEPSSGGADSAAKRVAEHFLEALKRDDWATAFADLHPEARADTPTPGVLRARIEKGDLKLLSWYANCGSSGSLARTGYNVTTSSRKTGVQGVRPIIVGVAPERSGKCNGPMVVELKVDPSLPDQAWRVRSFKYN